MRGYRKLEKTNFFSTALPSQPQTSADEVRAFIDGGWQRCANIEGDITDKGPLFHVDLNQFSEEVLPNLSEGDCVIVLSIQGEALFWRKQVFGLMRLLSLTYSRRIPADEAGPLLPPGDEERPRASSVTSQTHITPASSPSLSRAAFGLRERLDPAVKQLMEQLSESPANLCCVHVSKNGHLPLHFAGLEDQ